MGCSSLASPAATRPSLPESQIKGLVVVPQSNWRGEIRHEKRVDLFNRPYFWRGVTVTTPEAPPDTDVGAFYSGHVTVTPIKLDWTDQAELPELKKWGLAEQKND